jgi:NADP-reducing hydrogenase subunit HndB
MQIKNLDDLQKIKADSLKHTKAKRDSITQIIIGMGTCGIAAGARNVMNAAIAEIEKRNLSDIEVLQTGCNGMCQKEPLLDVARPGEDRVTYGPVMPTDVSRIITEHIVNGNIVEDLVIAKIPSKA